MKMFKVLAVVLALTLCFGAVSAFAVTPQDNDVVIAIEGGMSSMDPHNITDTNAISATRGMYEPLVGFDEERNFIGVLAESWEISEDASSSMTAPTSTPTLSWPTSTVSWTRTTACAVPPTGTSPLRTAPPPPV